VAKLEKICFISKHSNVNRLLDGPDLTRMLKCKQTFSWLKCIKILELISWRILMKNTWISASVFLLLSVIFKCLDKNTSFLKNPWVMFYNTGPCSMYKTLTLPFSYFPNVPCSTSSTFTLPFSSILVFSALPLAHYPTFQWNSTY
jgi:hypothetical protein